MLPLAPLDGIIPEDDQEEVQVDLRDVPVDQLRIEGLDEEDAAVEDDASVAEADDDSESEEGDHPVPAQLQLAADEAMARRQGSAWLFSESRTVPQQSKTVHVCFQTDVEYRGVCGFFPNPYRLC